MSRPGPVNILLVDDQPAKLLGYEVILKTLGENLLKASSARAALGLLLERDVAVVLVDVHMPDLDGFELAAMIREHPRFERTALIFVSAVHLSDIDRLKGYAIGGVDYVPVPVVPEVLRAKVRVFVDLHRKTRELEELNVDLERRVAERTAALEASRSELQTLNRRLERRIEERTREREQALAKLFEAQKLDTIGQLTGGVAHDFNNLLMAMMGSLEVLRKRLPADDGCRRLLDNALRGAERGAELTQRLLAFARRQDLRPKPVDIAQLLADVRRLVGGSVGPTISIVERIGRKTPAVLADAPQLEFALVNLMLNARDAMPDGGVLTIEARRSRIGQGSKLGISPGDYVKIAVIDNGMGMDAETLARAPEPFFTTKGAGNGTGLGLSMVHGLTSQSGGAVRIRSRLGAGTTVDLYFPVASGRAPAETPDAAQGPNAEAGVRVLLVDDDTLVSAGTRALLEDLGHFVAEVSSGPAALDLLDRGEPFDIVITDQIMPVMTGLELVRRIQERHSGLPVVLASGFAEIAPKAPLDPKLPRLAKPFTQRALAEAIARECGRVKPEGAAAVVGAGLAESSQWAGLE